MNSLFPRDLLARAFPGMPRLWAAFETQESSLDDHNQRIDGAEAQIAAVGATATQALETAASAQVSHTLLDGISALNGEAGAVELLTTDQVGVRPIDTADAASLLTKGRADTLYAGGGAVAHQADSTATTVAGIVSDFNALLAKMQAAGLMS